MLTCEWLRYVRASTICVRTVSKATNFHAARGGCTLRAAPDPVSQPQIASEPTHPGDRRHTLPLCTAGEAQLHVCRRYGLIGPNGCGKSCLLKSLAAREVAIPNHIDIYYLDREVAASDETALDCVKSVDEERLRLEKESERLSETAEMSPEVEQRLEDIYARRAMSPCSLRVELAGLTLFVLTGR